MTAAYSIQGKDSSQELGRVVCDWLNCQGCPDCPDIPFGRPADEVVAEMKALDPFDATLLPPTDRSHKPGDDNCLCPGCVRVRSDAFLRERFGKTLPIHVQAERAEQRVVDLENERLDRLALSRLDRVAASVQDTTTTDTNADLDSFTADLAGDVDTEPLPALVERTDGATVMYAGKLNSLFGVPGSGKSWVVIIAIEEAVMRGGRVLYLDYEDNDKTFKARSALLGFDVGAYADCVKYIRPGVTESPTAMAQATQWLTGAVSPTHNLVVLDACESAGCPSDGADIAPWFRTHIEPWRVDGNGVLMVDHVPKRSDDRPNGPIGSQAKLARIDGVALAVSGTPWTKQASGKIFLTNHKDRGGDIPAPVGKAVCVIEGAYTTVDGDKAFAYSINPPTAQDGEEPLNRKVLNVLMDAGVEGITGTRDLRLAVGGNAKAINEAARTLIDMGMVARDKVGAANRYVITATGIGLLELNLSDSDSA